jgi:hypothetical protein
MKKKAEKMKTDNGVKEIILESSAPRERFKELASLALFTLIAAAGSIIIMDIITFPLTIFAINNKNGYNYIFKYSFIIILAVLLIYLVMNKFFKMKKDGFPVKSIILYIAKKPLSYLGTAFAMIFISAILIAVIYILLNVNYIFLSKIIGS